jgi:predicted dehydrogenase
MFMRKLNIGIIGCGNISGIYFKTMKAFSVLDVVACADLIPDRAKASAKEYNIPHAYTVKELLADPKIDIVVNLTIPKAHAEVALSAIKAGKNVYGEKPLAINRADGAKILKAAKARGVRIGSAPDTFLGAGIQTCRKIIDDGLIGKPVACTAFMTCHGHESWHPAPDFYYQPGGGPMFDMGPYYLTALVNLIGPVKRASGLTRITFPQRLITSKPKHGTKIKVNTATHIAGTMDFANGAVGTIITSFDIWSANLPHIEIHGTEGSLSVPNPNIFGGTVKLFEAKKNEWKEIPLTHGYPENSRGLGVADMAKSILVKRPHRASGELAFHVLDIMSAFEESSRKGKFIKLGSTCARPKAFPVGLKKGELD